MLEINNLTKTFTDNKGGEICALSDVSLKIEDGQFVSVIGPSGCGKSTLLRIISGLDNATKGSVRIENNGSLNAGFVFQDNAAIQLQWPGASESTLRAIAHDQRVGIIVAFW